MPTFDYEDVVTYPASAIQMSSKNPVFNGSRNTDLYKSYMKSHSTLSATSGASSRQEVVVKTWRATCEISQGENRRLFKMVFPFARLLEKTY